MSHFDYPEKEADRVPREAVRIATYFASIVEGTVAGPRFGGATGVRCRRRPGRVPCSEVIVSELQPGGHELRWRCPVCDDNGVISSWAGTRWDPERKAERRRSGELFDRQPTSEAAEPSTHPRAAAALRRSASGSPEADSEACTTPCPRARRASTTSVSTFSSATKDRATSARFYGIHHIEPQDPRRVIKGSLDALTSQGRM
jgi:hypothetical protein